MLNDAIEIAKGAGAILLKQQAEGFQVSKKSELIQDFVTSADLASEKFILKELRKKFPNDPIISEESDTSVLDYSSRVWIVDPLDGTSAYSQHKDGYCVIIGCCLAGKPALGVVFDPVKGTLYYAEKGKGAFLQEGDLRHQLHVNSIDTIAQSRAILKPTLERTGRYDSWLNNLKVHEKLTMNSAGLEIMAVASGIVDFSFDAANRICKWDTCGPQVILEEAGGLITAVNGPLDYTQPGSKWKDAVIISNTKMHNPLLVNLGRAHLLPA
ncbi:MAG: 3'(2'),5'-bisphosphate nucleotidase CysQ [Candidatus Woesearchaeota archaeon]